MKPLLLPVALAVAVFSTAGAQTPDNATLSRVTQEDLYFQVEFREGQPPVTIHARIYDNRRPIASETVLAIHGFAHNAFSYEPLATKMMNSWGLRFAVDEVVAVSLPGHGASTIPLGDVQFGDLDVMDYVTAVRNTIGALHAEGIFPSVIMGHSMGGLNVMLLQQQLLDEGSSLYAEYGIDTAILIAPAIPAPVEAPPIDPHAMDPFIATNYLRGTYVDVMPQFMLLMAFSDTNGQLVDGTPGLGEYCSLGSVESLASFGDLVDRRFVEPGILADHHGTETAMLGFTEDVWIPGTAVRDAYAYVTGEDPDAPGTTFTLVENPGAVHNAYISQPEELIPGIRKVLKPWWWH